jgi:hypothetical protein
MPGWKKLVLVMNSFFYRLRAVNSPGLPIEELFPVKEISNTVVVRWMHYGGRIVRSIIF